MGPEPKSGGEEIAFAFQAGLSSGESIIPAAGKCPAIQGEHL